MKPVPFKDQNIVINEGKPGEIPAYVDKLNDAVVTCHQLTPDQIKEVIQTGKIWMSRKPMAGFLPVVALSVEKPLREMTEAEQAELKRIENPTRQQVRRQVREEKKVLKAVK